MKEMVTGFKGGVEIDLQKLLVAYLQKWWLIVLSGLLTAGVFWYVTVNHITPLYRASVMIYVNNYGAEQQVNYISGSNLATAQMLVSTYSNIIRSDTVLTKVVEKGELDCAPEAIRGMMTTAQVDDTEMFTLSITHADPEMAAKIANVVADVAPAEIEKIVEGSSTRIIDYAKVPTGQYSPNNRSNTILGGFIGAALALLYITLRHLLDVRLREAEDLEQLFDFPVLGQIPAFDAVGSKKSGYAYEAAQPAASNRREGGVN